VWDIRGGGLAKCNSRDGIQVEKKGGGGETKKADRVPKSKPSLTKVKT